MRVAAGLVIAACAAPATVTVPVVKSNVATGAAGAELSRHDSVDAFCASFAEEEATPSNGPCEYEHGSCGSEPVKDVAPIRALIVRWNNGSSPDRHEDVAFETPRGVFFVGLDLIVKTCDPEDTGPPNGGVALSRDHDALVATYDVFHRTVRVGPDSPPSTKQTCTVRCDVRDRPRCDRPVCGAWSDVD